MKVCCAVSGKKELTCKLRVSTCLVLAGWLQKIELSEQKTARVLTTKQPAGIVLTRGRHPVDAYFDRFRRIRPPRHRMRTCIQKRQHIHLRAKLHVPSRP